MQFHNSTALDSRRLLAAFTRHSRPYRHDHLTVRVRYSRGADFSGTCYYRNHRIFINIGRHNRYPYTLGTHIARASSDRTHWWREIYCVVLADAYHLALFIYLHELFHSLVSASGRNTRRKESMCDRFATRVLADDYGCPVVDRGGHPAPRCEWDFQDLERFVVRAPRAVPAVAACAGRSAADAAEPPDLAASGIPVLIHGLSATRIASTRPAPAMSQLLLPFGGARGGRIAKGSEPEA